MVSILWGVSFILPLPLPFTGMAQCCFSCLTAVHWGCFSLYHASHCHSLWWLCIVSGVPYLLIGVGPRHPICPTATHFGGSGSLCVSHYCSSVSRVWFTFVPGESLLLTEVALCYLWFPLLLKWVVLCCPSCPMDIHFGGFASHSFSLVFIRWLWVISASHCISIGFITC